jgi:hypothetical protein
MTVVTLLPSTVAIPPGMLSPRIRSVRNLGSFEYLSNNFR